MEVQMRLATVLRSVLLGALFLTPSFPDPATAQPAEFRVAPYRGVEIPWFLGWDTRVTRVDAGTLEYVIWSDELSSLVRMRARSAVANDAADIAEELRALKERPVPPGRSRKIHKVKGGFAVVYVGKKDVQARALLLITDGRGSSYLSLIGTWPIDSQFRMAIVAQRFLSGVINR